MSLSDQLVRNLAQRVGVESAWRDMAGQTRPVAVETQRALLAALGFPCASADDARAALAALDAGLPARLAAGRLIVARVGEPVDLPVRAEPGEQVDVTLEGGELRRVATVAGAFGGLALPAFDIPGYHEARLRDGAFAIAAAPRRAPGFHDIAGAREGWGLAAQVYSLGAGVECGVGDFGGVAKLARAAGKLGADVLEISPVHSLLGVPERYDSPYAPSSRLFLDPVYADARLALPGWLDEAAGEATRREEVDWPAARRAKSALHRALYFRLKQSSSVARAEFEAFAADASDALRRHALFEALRAGRAENWDWRHWPDPDRDIARAEPLAAERADEIDFHIFLQWLTQRSYAAAQAQAKEAGMRLGLVADIPTGVDPAGGDVWARPGDFLRGATMGAPPDSFTASGQDWRLTTFSPTALAARDYAPFIDLLRANLAHAGGLRLDHAMAVQRLWLIPQGASPREGAYVRFPAETLLRLIDLEAWRRHALVIGEDLGTLPHHFREYLAEHGVLGMRFLRMEQRRDGFRPPQDWSPGAVALTATHDVVATAGWWKGVDLPRDDEAARARRQSDCEQLWQALRQAGVAEGEPPSASQAHRVVDAAFAFIGMTPCELKIVTLEDAFATEIQPNVPGTLSEAPNWRFRYAHDPDRRLEDLTVAARLAKLSQPPRREQTRAAGVAVATRRSAMPRITYKIERTGETWSVLRNGDDGGSFLTQEAAFENAVAYAGGDLRTGHDIIIEAATPTDPRGATESGGAPKRGDGFS